MKWRLDTHTREAESKYCKLEPFTKPVSATLKSVGEFDYKEYFNTISKIEKDTSMTSLQKKPIEKV